MFSRSRALLLQLALLMSLAGCSDEATRRACDPPQGPGCLAPGLDTAGLGRFASATLSNDERLAAASWDTSRGALVVAFFDASNAISELRVVAKGEGGPTRIAAEPSGQVQLVWFDRGLGRAFWARGDRNGFSSPELIGEGPGILGTHLALALDTSSRPSDSDPVPVPHVALRDETRRNLSYAVRQPEGWRLEPVDTCAGEADCPGPDEDVGEWAQLALVPGAGGVWLPRIAFYDRLRGDLKLAARGEDGRWQTSTLDGRDPATGADTGDVGRFITLASTPGRTLGIAYFDATREALRYLGPGEAPRIVDAGLANTSTSGLRDAASPSALGLRPRVNVGQHASLRYDAVGQGHIVYADATTPALRHVTVRTANTSGPVVLPLPPGAWPTLTRIEDLPDGGVRLHGVYGAFGTTPARSSLEVFTHDLAPTNPSGATP